MFLNLFLALLIALALGSSRASAQERPIYIGVDAEFGLVNSLSAQAIERGVRIAASEINEAGGVLGGRRLEVVIRDNKSSPARARDNLAELADIPDLVAVFCGRFSPVVLEVLPLIHEKRLILLDPWASADGVTDHPYRPNYVFRLSLRDQYAMEAMVNEGARKGVRRFGLLLPNTGWGRSNSFAAQRAAQNHDVSLVDIRWCNWGERSFIDPVSALREAGAEAVLLVANDLEAIPLLQEMARFPADQRLPVIAHWGLTGGRFSEKLREELAIIDFTVVQSFSFFRADSKQTAAFLAGWRKLYGATEPEAILAPVGVGHAYDLTHLLAKAIERAGTTDRSAVRDALEGPIQHQGLVRLYAPAFTPERHDALDPSDVFMARYRADGVLVPIETSRAR